MNTVERDRLMVNALEDIALAALRRNTLSTTGELTSVILKMESIASIALRKLEGRIAV